MTRYQQYEVRLAALRDMLNSITVRMPPDPLGFLNGNWKIAMERRDALLASLSYAQTIELAMYGSYKRRHLN